MPSSQGRQGRDHNPFVLHQLARGGGIKGGHQLRPERRVGLQAARSRQRRPMSTTSTPRSCTCLGIDHNRLTFRHNGIDRRLTDVHGHVLTDLLA